jgi:hypothetical protein
MDQEKLFVWIRKYIPLSIISDDRLKEFIEINWISICVSGIKYSNDCFIKGKDPFELDDLLSEFITNMCKVTTEKISKLREFLKTSEYTCYYNISLLDAYYKSDNTSALLGIVQTYDFEYTSLSELDMDYNLLTLCFEYNNLMKLQIPISEFNEMIVKEPLYMDMLKHEQRLRVFYKQCSKPNFDPGHTWYGHDRA